ncbi:MAG TPA: type II toxin-antitoxin system VapC family toxin [Acidobacteriaceae bacterium]|nr:type II toxin-antitoxin system VapC family toxin [Acidobacteriaceae bacterium]
MITAIDANVILDTLVGTPEEISVAHAALRSAEAQGGSVVSTVAYAEIAQRFQTKAKVDDFFSLLGCGIEPLDEESAFVAGQLARQYRLRGGSRTRILPDFLIGAHAQLRADRLLTRDRRFFRDTFPKLKAVLPSELS